MKYDIVLITAATTLVVYLFEKFTGSMRKPIHYLWLFIFLLLLRLLFTCFPLEAEEGESLFIGFDEPICLEEVQCNFSYFQASAVITEKQKNYILVKMDEFKKKGKAHFNEANRICLFIPDATDREKADFLFRQAVLLSISFFDYRTIVANLIVELANYGLKIYEQYQKIEDNLIQSKLAFENYNYFKKILEDHGYKIPTNGTIK